MKERLLKIAEEKGLYPTEYFDKIIKAKERLGFELSCPCDPKNEKRYCVSDLCIRDIKKNGTCHCNCWMEK